METNKPFLTEEDAKQYAESQTSTRGTLYNQDADRYFGMIDGYNACAERANARIAELEKSLKENCEANLVLNKMLDERDTKIEQLENKLYEENAIHDSLLQKNIRLEKERDEYAIKFADWIVTEGYSMETFVDWIRWHRKQSYDTFTTEQLLAQFKQLPENNPKT